MMDSLLHHPALPLVLAGLFVPLLKGPGRTVVMLAAPLLAILMAWVLPTGVLIEAEFLSYNLQILEGDKLARLFALVFAIMAFVGNLYALKQTNNMEVGAANIYAGVSIATVLAGDIVSVFLFWEMMAIFSTTVIFAGGTDAAKKAGMRYLILHLLGGVVLMAGVVGHVVQTGNIEFTSLTAYLSEGNWAYWLILAGFVLNTGAPPFSAWVPDSYPEATPTGMVYLSAFTTKTAVYVLIVTFPGAEVLIYVGLYMIFWGILYGLCENKPRKMLGYSIVNQVGFMVVAVGIGNEYALNGAAGHAFAHIIYKALLIMGAGAVVMQTGKAKFTELGGLYKYMPVTMVCSMIGGLAISAFPLTSGFVAKAFTSEGAVQAGQMWVYYLLAAGSAGVFLDVGVKLHWFVYFNKDRGLKPAEAPIHMRAAMGLFAFLCLIIGLMPQTFYTLLPYALEYEPNTASHLIEQAQLLIFGAVAFFLFLPKWHLVNSLTLDLDWLWRRPLLAALKWITATAGSIRDSLQAAGWRGVNGMIDYVRTHYGPDSALSRTLPTGQMGVAAVVMLGAFLVLYYMG